MLLSKTRKDSSFTVKCKASLVKWMDTLCATLVDIFIVRACRRIPAWNFQWCNKSSSSLSFSFFPDSSPTSSSLACCFSFYPFNKRVLRSSSTGYDYLYDDEDNEETCVIADAFFYPLIVTTCLRLRETHINSGLTAVLLSFFFPSFRRPSFFVLLPSLNPSFPSFFLILHTNGR